MSHKSLLMLSALCLATPLEAQLAPGVSGFSGAPISASQAVSWAFLSGFGSCLAATKRSKALAMMRTAVDSPQETAAFKSMIAKNDSNACMSEFSSATFERGHVRGAIAEALYEAQPIARSNQPVPAIAATDAPVRSIHDFADCYVAGHYDDARSLLRDTRLGTTSEQSRVKVMANEFGPCLPAGKQIQIVATDIRMALAGALYRTTLAEPAITQVKN